MHKLIQRQSQARKDNSINPARSQKVISGMSMDSNALLQLQGGVGEQAVLRVLRSQERDSTRRPSLQAKLTVSSPGDSYEQEADRIVERVMRTPDPRLRRTCACGGGCPKCHEQRGDDRHLLVEQAHRHDAGGIVAPPIVHQVLRSSGQPLDSSTREFMESRFGHDFSHVRVHTNAEAAESAQAVGALAYTVGRDIVFGAGHYAPTATAGRRLLAHELVHTLQQSKAGRAEPAMIQRAVQISAAYKVVSDFDPAVQIKNQDPALGRSVPLLNSEPLAPRMSRNRFQTALNKPTLARRNLDNIQKPDLNDPVLDPVRARTAFVSYGQWNSRRVQLVQEALIAWGRGLEEPVQMLPAYGADGNFKDETLAAVKRFQRESPTLAADGVVGDLTLGALQKAMGELQGSVFSLDTVGDNDFQGLIHIPPPPGSWTSLLTTPISLIDNPAIEVAIKVQLANFFVTCPRGGKVRVFFVNPSGNIPALILVHEKHHEQDQLKTLKAHMVPWDSALEALKASGQRFRAATPQEATAQIFARANLRNPCELSTDIVHEWQVDNANFHSTLAGGGVKQDIENLECTTVTFSLGPPTSSRQVAPPGRPGCATPGPSLVVSREIPV